MRKVIVIAVREYQAAVRTKMFIISLVFIPVLGGGGAVATWLLEGQVDVTDRNVAVIDRTGVLFEPLAEAAKARNETVVDPRTDKQVKPRFLLERLEPAAADPTAQRLALSEQVRAKRWFAFLDIDAGVLDPSASESSAPIQYYSNNPAYEDIEHFAAQPLNNAIQTIRLNRAGIDKQVVDRATRWVSVTSLGLLSRDAQSGQVAQPGQVNKAAHIVVPMIFMFLMFMVVMLGATPLMHGVLEEKMQRIAEVLLGSVTPFQLMAGKLLGMVGVSLTVMTLYMTCGIVAAGWSGYGQYVPAHLIKWFVVYQVLAVLMFGSMFGAVGAACSDLKEAQSAFFPVWLIVCIPLFVWIQVAREPSSTFSTVVSLFPPATPMLMLLRQAVPPGPPLWQPFLGILLVVLTTLACIFASGRVFRIGLLMQGKGASLRQMLHWAIRG